MGWDEVAVLTAGPAYGDWVSEPHQPRVLGLEGKRRTDSVRMPYGDAASLLHHATGRLSRVSLFARWRSVGSRVRATGTAHC
jgi:hypothetical protein